MTNRSALPAPPLRREDARQVRDSRGGSGSYRAHRPDELPVRGYRGFRGQRARPRHRRFRGDQDRGSTTKYQPLDFISPGCTGLLAGLATISIVARQRVQRASVIRCAAIIGPDQSDALVTFRLQEPAVEVRSDASERFDAETPSQNSLLCVQTVFRFVQNHRLGAVNDLVSDLVTTVSGQAMHEQCILVRSGH